MLHSFCCGVALLALLGAGLAAQDQKTPRDRDKPDQPPGNAGKSGGQKTSQGEQPLRFDVSGFLRDHDLNKDGMLDKDELPPRLQDRFAQLDTNKDGKLSKEELEQGIVFLQPARRPADVLVVLIEMSDCDECCAEELAHFYAMLRKLDKDNDGKFSPEELAAARRTLVEDRVANLFKELDRDKDGYLSRDEARGYVRRD